MAGLPSLVILVSEVMLQQTQVSRVEKFYPKFLAWFPDFKSLARAKTADVLRVWQGLGYNRRALMLQRLARVVVKEYGGKLSRDRATLESLPGIGKGTSGSLMAFAFNKPVVFIETNIRRVFIHHFFPNRRKVSDAEIEPWVAKTLDAKRPREWYWALMDYGATLGAKTHTAETGDTEGTADTTETKKLKKKFKNPNRRSRHYVQQSKFAGSDRELRGKIVKLFLEKKSTTPIIMAKILKEPLVRVKKITNALSREGFF